MSKTDERGTRVPRPVWIALFAAECAGLVAGIRGWWLFAHWDIHEPDAFFRAAWIGPLAVGAAMSAVVLAWRNGARFEALANLPLLALLLQPLKPWFYLTNSQILPTLPFCLAAAVMMRCVMTGYWPGLSALRRFVDRFSAARAGLQSLCVFAGAFGVYIFLSSNLVFPVFPFTGDEPHYLILTHSIVSEGDTNLYDNYYLAKDYRKFYPGELTAHTHALDRKRELSYSTHMPATSAALVPFYWPAAHLPTEWMHFFIRVGMGFYTALLVAQAFLFMRFLFGDSRTALAGSVLVALSPPLLFYSRCVYPEVFAGLLIVVALRIILDRHSARGYLVAATALALMPWFGTKYSIFAVVFSIVFGALRWREGIRRPFTYVAFLIPLALSAALLLGFLKHYYGEYSPQAIYRPPWNQPSAAEATETPAVAALNRGRALLGYFYDQRVGLLVFAPVYVMAFPGVLLLLRRRPREAWVLISVTGFYILFYAYNMSWGGQAPPSRPLVSIAPLLACFAAAFIAWAPDRWRILRDSLIAITLISSLVLLQKSHLLYDTISNHDWQGRSLLLTHLSNPYIDFTRFVPQFLERNDFNLPATIAWPLLLAFLMVAFIRSLRRTSVLSGQVRARCALIFAATLLLALLNLLEPGYVITSSADELAHARVHRLDSLNFGPELGGLWTKGGRSTRLLIEEDRKLKSLRVAMTPVTSNQVTLWAYDRCVIDRRDVQGRIEHVVPLIWSYRWGSKLLYAATVRTRIGRVPGNGDTRPLGVFVELDPTPAD